VQLLFDDQRLDGVKLANGNANDRGFHGLILSCLWLFVCAR
jgi:hypothetical protein